MRQTDVKLPSTARKTIAKAPRQKAYCFLAVAVANVTTATKTEISTADRTVADVKTSTSQRQERDISRELTQRRRADPRVTVDELPYSDEKPQSIHWS
ncbi:hypothetical protein GLAREA_06703 [Glarea lozoyensis ATCC 20868]|uniref:Uncharacterized protein n=1 Tax=Glarea lozoyensis (strain ATCC 20868 / MF5171) TaxID=1116229 RepID=S3D7E4_GLAL2|nr:uncharacterized protein GLAREA_06703 [Glarea lozoyensis ATCC 20868]EPE33690.1 hypothetical protein GLAREA_06703 [Glarea lozoyensis ATCC 20868]